MGSLNTSLEGNVREGDPLSPFLFTRVVYVLSGMLSKGFERGHEQGLIVGMDRLEVSNPQFVNKTILFISNNKDNFLHVHSLL